MDRVYPDRRDVLISAALFLIAVGVFAALNCLADYPKGNEWQVAIILSLAVAAVPLLFRILFFLQHTRSSFEIKGFKIDFGKAVTIPTIQLAENVVEQNQPVEDTGTTKILEVARQAHRSPVVVVDLRSGKAWYKTRLFALAAPALEFGYPRVIVFLAALNATPCSYLGFADAAAVASAIMKDENYKLAFKRAVAKYHQLAAFADGSIKPKDFIFQESVQREVPYFEGRPSLMALLIHEMINLEKPPNAEPWISAPDVQQLLADSLHTDKIEERKNDPDAIYRFISGKADYIAVVQGHHFVGLVPATRVIREVLRTLAGPA